jgi:iron complex outermembrane receptor protein
VGIGTDLPNIESIQILKGPQGTLYGRNATGGAILIKTLDPMFSTEGNIEAGYGRFNEAKAKLYLTTPLSSDLAVNVSAYYRRSDGFVRDVRTNDLLTKQHFVNLRSKLLWSPDSSTRILLTVSYDELSDPSALAMHAINGNTAGNLVANSVPLADKRGFASMNVRPVQEQSGYSAVLDAQTDIGFATLRSISSYRKEKIHIENDLDSSYAQVGSSNFQQRFETYGEQLILNGRAGRFLDWVAGVEYIYNNARAPYYQVSGATPGVPGSSGLKSDAFAAYVDGTAHLGKFSIIGGIRYSNEKKHKVFRRTTSGPWLIDVSKRFKDVTPRLGLQYAIDGRSNVYATWSKGFKSGTFNPTVNDIIPVNPEKATAYEVGFKTSQPTFRLNTSAYYYRYSDIQVSAYDYTTGTSRLINAAKAEIYGADANLTISPTREFDLHVGAAYTHARYSSSPGAIVNTPRPGGRTGNVTNIVDASGTVMIRAPAFTASAGMNYRTDLGSGNIEFAVSGSTAAA